MGKLTQYTGGFSQVDGVVIGQWVGVEADYIAIDPDTFPNYDTTLFYIHE